ncbi:hypothetical protein CAPTEDRAFT_195283 [Capitella teleta]|uniref:Uncharacterized protein n=1 Tax=Capitella teleta TaxID=283909 RepID=R7UJ50_CAPTE|nr:hypothetical protein CAPTEDRAFT_195283 [Capitella teleta]|eukprot:ELU03828.1 hypothetical protein CAPTEDRAFT_195283 [Capitella teleta]
MKSLAECICEFYNPDEVYVAREMLWDVYGQEHLYLDTDISKIAQYIDNVEAVGVSGMEDSQLISGRPYGGFDKYYDDIVRVMRSSAEVTIPICKERGKAGCSTHVKQFQEDAIFWNRIWVENGRPTTGSLTHSPPNTEISVLACPTLLRQTRRFPCFALFAIYGCYNLLRIISENIKEFDCVHL